jgi:hypothetical protein
MARPRTHQTVRHLDAHESGHEPAVISIRHDARRAPQQEGRAVAQERKHTQLALRRLMHNNNRAVRQRDLGS